MSSDPSPKLLERCLGEANYPALLIVDENLDPGHINWPSCHPELSVLTNRWDIGHALSRVDREVTCNDFNFQQYRPEQFRTAIYRVSKEKAIVHHIINQCGRVIETGGKLLLIGHKQEGLLSYQRRAVDYLGGGADTHRSTAGYRTIGITRSPTLGRALDDGDYSQLRACINADELLLHSKPGIYGWNKIDRGSRLLMDNFDQLTARANAPESPSILDLGCGYGYLSARAAQLSNVTIWATDNNCAAVEACTKNFGELGINGKVVADDCARHIKAEFDYVLCNPPFHRGFETSRQVTELFLQQAAKRLKPSGTALFVVNQFIGLEKAAARYFGKTDEMARLDGFKLIRMAH